jgi:hypothetical protein
MHTGTDAHKDDKKIKFKKLFCIMEQKEVTFVIRMCFRVYFWVTHSEKNRMLCHYGKRSLGHEQ